MTDAGYPSQVREWTLAMQSVIFFGADVGASRNLNAINDP